MSGIYTSQMGVLVKDCPQCGVTKTLNEYSKHKREKDGIRSNCKICVAVYNKLYAEGIRKSEEPKVRLLVYTVKNDPNRRQNANKKLVRNLKNNPCADCGKTYEFYNMDFDHLPGTDKKFNISDGVGKATDVLLAEIAKCELVCKVCHGDRTHSRGYKRGRPRKDF